MTAKQTRKQAQDGTDGETDATSAQQQGAPFPAGEPEASSEPAGSARADGEQAEAPETPRSGDGSAEADAMRDRYLRLAAEFDNYRKRTERERGESWGRAQAQLVERILDALDDLQRVAHVSPEGASVASVLEGVQMVERKLVRLLEGAGLEVVDAEGKPFDPSVHEAIVSTPTEDESADDTVAEVFQKGYSFKGSLIRPARVRVHKFGG
jgi:molecular chaperone GrpE